MDVHVDKTIATILIHAILFAGAYDQNAICLWILLAEAYIFMFVSVLVLMGAAIIIAYYFLGIIGASVTTVVLLWFSGMYLYGCWKERQERLMTHR